MTLDQRIEAILFAGAKPFTTRKISELLDVSLADVEAALRLLEERLSTTAIMLQRGGSEIQLVTQPSFARDVELVIRDSEYGELTRPSLEALTILAYRGPLTRPELEQIRGVQSTLILRNLMMRGLVEEHDELRVGQPLYSVTLQVIQRLGLKSLEELPGYQELRGHENVVDALKDLENEPVSETGTTEEVVV